MRKYLLIYAAAVTVALWWCMSHYRPENRRLKQNQELLMSQCLHYSALADSAACEVQALRLRTSELRELRTEDARRIREMGIRLRRLEAAATTTVESRIENRAPLHDTITIHARDTVFLHDTLRMFRWRDSWVEVSGTIQGDSIDCLVTSVDTLHQVVHRIPRRFLFFRWGTKALHQRIISSNPHTRIVATEYIKIER